MLAETVPGRVPCSKESRERTSQREQLKISRSQRGPTEAGDEEIKRQEKREREGKSLGLGVRWYFGDKEFKKAGARHMENIKEAERGR